MSLLIVKTEEALSIQYRHCNHQIVDVEILFLGRIEIVPFSTQKITVVGTELLRSVKNLLKGVLIYEEWPDNHGNNFVSSSAPKARQVQHVI